MALTDWTPNEWLSLCACVAILALGLIVLIRGARNPLALPLGLLCIDMFVWNFATFAGKVSSAPAWDWLDVSFSPFTPPLALHLILIFVGQRRPLRWVLRLAYLAFGASGLLAASAFFLQLGRDWVHSDVRNIVFLSLWLPLIGLEVVLLARHWKRSSSFEEQWRARLILASVVVGSVFGSTEMWDEFLDVPALGHLGALGSMAIVAAVVFRSRLFGSGLSTSVALYALAVAAVGTFAYLLLFRTLSTTAAPFILGTASITLVLVAAARDAASLVVARRERLRQLAGLGRFSAQMAHDLRNPLAALKGALQLLLQERERLPEDRREYLDLMLLQSQRMEEVIETYRRLSCVEPVLRPTSVNELVERALTQAALAGDQGAEGIRIRQELREGLPTLQADQELLASALENVVRNAREAMPHGGALEVRTLFEPRERARGDVVIRIADDGVGMDARQLERAFDDFFTTKAQGSGLGLSFARRVVEAHGGEVRLSSALGRGTVVEFVLPAGEAAGRGGAA